MSKCIKQVSEPGTVAYVNVESPDGVERTAYILGKHGVWYPVDSRARYRPAHEIDELGWELA